MNLYERILKKEEKISVVGLGYVGVPLAVEFAKYIDVIGFDINKEKVKQYLNGNDVTKEVGNEEMKKTKVKFTHDEKRLTEARFHIIAVPTPTNDDKTPDLRPIIEASKTLGRNLSKGSIVVYESTVYPGVTEDICIPLLEETSGMKCGTDFKVGYSPERINPGDKFHRLQNIKKVVSGIDEYTLEIVAKVYELVINAGVYRAESIKVAEAAKVIENSQRDINIAFVNELSMIFNKMGIDTKAVLEAAGTKWNFLKFSPGLVGGHCIGVDPYYLTHKAEQLGYHSQVILSGRRINDSMGKYVAENTVKKIIEAGKAVKEAKVAILGLTFKEDCPDTRNSKVVDIIKELNEYGINPIIVDPVADKDESFYELTKLSDVSNVDAIIIAVAHEEFKQLNIEIIDKLFKDESNDKKVIIDVKSILNKKHIEDKKYRYWRL